MDKLKTPPLYSNVFTAVVGNCFQQVRWWEGQTLLGVEFGFGAMVGWADTVRVRVRVRVMCDNQMGPLLGLRLGLELG